jgi:hypothetical protein
MLKNIFCAFIIAQVGFCAPDCKEGPPTISTLTEQEKASLPYTDGEQLKFEHNDQTKLSFLVNSTSETVEDHYCDECCYQYSYDLVEATLQSEYPIFSISINLSSNEYGEPYYSLSIGDDYFLKNEIEQGQLFESILLNEKSYEKVFAVKNTRIESPALKVDSLYYSFQQGIVKFIMTNGEKYEIL